MKTTNRFLLTGAGFTANFGGLLANDMWRVILNRPELRNEQRVKDFLLRNFDFEDVYHQIIEGDFAEHEKDAIGDAVKKAYEVIDNKIRNFTFARDSPFPVNMYGVRKLISAFSGSSSEPGFIFTLNQDLFLERKHYGGSTPILPGVNADRRWFSTNFNGPLESDDYRQLPSAAEVDTLRRDLPNHHFYYLKLHGSSNWRDKSLRQNMVIGRDKQHQIEREPLLLWYLQMFKDILTSRAVKLLVIGYGFGDPHINEVLATGVDLGGGLRISIMTTEEPRTLYNRISKTRFGEKIWLGLENYYKYPLSQLFPADQSTTEEWHELETGFFGSSRKRGDGGVGGDSVMS